MSPPNRWLCETRHGEIHDGFRFCSSHCNGRIASRLPSTGIRVLTFSAESFVSRQPRVTMRLQPHPSYSTQVVIRPWPAQRNAWAGSRTVSKVYERPDSKARLTAGIFTPVDAAPLAFALPIGALRASAPGLPRPDGQMKNICSQSLLPRLLPPFSGGLSLYATAP